MYRTERKGFETLKIVDANMRHVLQPELLDAMKACLRDLENVKTVSPNESLFLSSICLVLAATLCSTSTPGQSNMVTLPIVVACAVAERAGLPCCPPLNQR